MQNRKRGTVKIRDGDANTERFETHVVDELEAARLEDERVGVLRLRPVVLPLVESARQPLVRLPAALDQDEVDERGEQLPLRPRPPRRMGRLAAHAVRRVDAVALSELPR